MRKRYNAGSSARKAAFAVAAIEAAGETSERQRGLEDVTAEAPVSRGRMESLLISSYDKKRLITLLNRLDTNAEDRTDVEDLQQEIQRGAEVLPHEVPPDVVTMNSRVRVTDLEDASEREYTIVFPHEAKYEEGKISILAPLGIALLGYRVGDVVDWDMPRGARRLRINQIVYQPEASGDYEL